MGAWGYRILENDYVLDSLTKIDPFYNIEREKLEGNNIHLYSLASIAKQAVIVENRLFIQLKVMLVSDYEYDKLLAVGLIDSAINQPDYNLFTSQIELCGHMSFLNAVADMKSLSMLKDEALKAIDELIDEGATSWDSPKDRLEIYYVFRHRLKEAMEDTE